mmetsp:Transcript_22620/g.57197  ORF Transcript_22620/g.57197 Transcript_22620/m.57197 type:complete len:215 (+) Transcript_22620:283-927(+)
MRRHPGVVRLRRKLHRASAGELARRVLYRRDMRVRRVRCVHRHPGIHSQQEEDALLQHIHLLRHVHHLRPPLPVRGWLVHGHCRAHTPPRHHWHRHGQLRVFSRKPVSRRQRKGLRQARLCQRGLRPDLREHWRCGERRAAQRHGARLQGLRRQGLLRGGPQPQRRHVLDRHLHRRPLLHRGHPDGDRDVLVLPLAQGPARQGRQTRKGRRGTL